MLNGGSYVVNRYMWAYSMLVSFIAVKMYPQMMEMHFKKKIALFWAGITYICLCLEMLGKHQKQYVLVALLLFSGKREQQQQCHKYKSGTQPPVFFAAKEK